jgi:hypothetical protein
MALLRAVDPAEADTFRPLVVQDFEGAPSITPKTLPVKSSPTRLIDLGLGRKQTQHTTGEIADMTWHFCGVKSETQDCLVSLLS